MTAPRAAAAGIGTSATYGISPKVSNRTARIHDVPSGASAAAYQPPVESARAASPPAQGGLLRSAGPARSNVSDRVIRQEARLGGMGMPGHQHDARPRAPHSEQNFPPAGSGAPTQGKRSPAKPTAGHPSHPRPRPPRRPADTAAPFPGAIGPYPECPDMDGPYLDRQRTGIRAERRDCARSR
jgi:hypothetical protein